MATDAHGYIRVDGMLASRVSGVCVKGNCNGRGAFTHTACNDFEIIAAKLFDDAARRVPQRVPGDAIHRSAAAI